jgi:tetratricopeptide (TPR) repeat protein
MNWAGEALSGKLSKAVRVSNRNPSAAIRRAMRMHTMCRRAARWPLVGVWFLCSLGPAHGREVVVENVIRFEVQESVMTDAEAQRVYDIARGDFFDRKKYKQALRTFEALYQYSPADLKDDSLYYLGRCHYRLDQNPEYATVLYEFQEYYPDSNIIESDEFKGFLLRVIKEEDPEDLYYILRLYYLLIRVAPETETEAKAIIQTRAAEDLRICSEEYYGKRFRNYGQWDEILPAGVTESPVEMVKSPELNALMEVEVVEESIESFAAYAWQRIFEEDEETADMGLFRRHIHPETIGRCRDAEWDGWLSRLVGDTFYKACKLCLSKTFNDIAAFLKKDLFDIGRPSQ